MTKRLPLWVTTLACVVAVLAAAPVTAQTCGPLDDGRLADVRFEGTVIQFDPVVEFREMVLTIGGPCEDIIRVFDSKEAIFFDIREIERVTDGQYTWQLKRVSNIDPGVQEKLQGARGTGEEDDLWWAFFQKGAIPEGPYTDSGSFTVDRGVIVDPGSGEEKRASLADRSSGGRSAEAVLAGALGSGEPSGDSRGNVLAPKDTVLTNANGVIRNSLCVGFDCLNNNTYSDTTILLTENNTRIKFDDTSSINSFPRNDWEIEANSSLNGGQSYLGFNDCGQSSGGGCATDLVFAVEAGVRQNALYVESDGDVGLGTSNPVVRLHMIDGDTPALRLEQDGSSGFQPQVWDVAGNETNFFVRDATNGSTLPFRIEPGVASSMLYLDSNERVGIGTSSPSNTLHVSRSDGTAKLLVTETNGTATARELAEFQNNGNAVIILKDNSVPERWTYTGGSNYLVNNQANPGVEYTFGPTGNFTAAGTITPGSSRSIKNGFNSVEPTAILDKVLSLPISSWSYNGDGDVRHIGPMSEDFFAAFQVGGDKGISVTDSAGVALAAIQGLHQRLADRDAEIATLQERLADLTARLEELALGR